MSIKQRVSLNTACVNQMSVDQMLFTQKSQPQKSKDKTQFGRDYVSFHFLAKKYKSPTFEASKFEEKYRMKYFELMR